MHLWLALFRLTLRLYPAAFRTIFADEIEAVLVLRLEGAARLGSWNLLRTALGEWFGLLGGACREWRHTLRRSRLDPQRRLITWTLVGLIFFGIGVWGRILLFHAYERHAFGGLIAALVGLILGALWFRRRAPRLSSGLLLGGGGLLLTLIAWQLDLQVLVLAAIPALTLTMTLLLLTRPSAPDRRRGARLFFGIIGALIFGVVWIGFFPFLTIFTEILLAPWAEAASAARPPVGTTSRGTNDFFRTAPGVMIPAGVTLGASLITLTASLWRTPARAELPWIWAAVAMVGMLVNLTVLLILPQLGFCFNGCSPITYAQRWPGMVLLVVNSAALPLAPVWLSRRLRLRSGEPQTASERV